MNLTNPMFHKDQCPIRNPVFYVVNCDRKDHTCCWKCDQCGSVIHTTVEKDLLNNGYDDLTRYGLKT